MSPIFFPLVIILCLNNFLIKKAHMIFDVQTWFLKKPDIQKINNYRKTELGLEEVSLLNIFSLGGNLLPVVIAVGMAVILMDDESYNKLSLMKIIQLINNGSLPLICYSIILSGLIFLLDKTDPAHLELRKKILGIGILLLFLSVSLYTLLTSSSLTIKQGGHLFLFALSIFLMFNAVKITYTMVLLQQKVVGDYSESVKITRQSVGSKSGQNNSSDIKFD